MLIVRILVFSDECESVLFFVEILLAYNVGFCLLCKFITLTLVV